MLRKLELLKHNLPKWRVYYMLHIKPSKLDRARVIPIGDGLGRVIAEIIRHVKRFYGTAAVPSCDHWDHHERQPRPRAPYLLQGAKHPSPLGIQTILLACQPWKPSADLKRRTPDASRTRFSPTRLTKPN